MISLSAAMLVSLGFLLAALAVVIFLPSYRRRLERFSLEKLRRELPLSEEEIRADKDRLRAEFALALHGLETRLESATTASARQSIEINRREARIHELSETIEGHKLTVEEHENARRVLEQAILDRLPKVEQRLVESRKILAQRDAEISLLSETSAKQTAALEEATQINIQQSEELDRLRTTLETRLARNRETLGDPRFDGEVALKSDIEMLRAKTRDQAAMIARLQASVSTGNAKAAAEREREVASLRIELKKLESELISARFVTGDDEADGKAAVARIRSLEKNEKAQGEEIARLRTAVASYKSGQNADDERSKLAAKAEVETLKTEREELRRTIQSLRADLASSQEKLARQAEHFSDELRRLSSRAIAAATQELRQEAGRRASLVDRLSSPRPPKLAAVAAANDAEDRSDGGDGTPQDHGNGKVTADSASGTDGTDRPDEAASSGSDSDGEAAAPRRPRLLERISSLDKQGG